MGQYHILANWDKKEWVNPHVIGLGLKQGEQIGNIHASLGDILYLLVSISNGRGGGDVPTEGLEDMLGRWAGDRVLIAGDYSKVGDVDITYPDGGLINPANDIYRASEESDKWTDISFAVNLMIEALWGYRMVGGGWQERKLVRTGTYLGPWKGDEQDDGQMVRPDMVISLPKEEQD